MSKGDRVAVSLGNNIEHAIATYALFKLGAILVPLNPTFNINQVAAALTHLDASHLVIGTETCLSRKDPRSNVPLLRQLVPNLEGKKLESELVPSLRHVVVVDNSAGRVDPKPFSSTTSYEAIAQDPGLMHSLKAPDLHPDEIINIQFTSGTTSTPKAACLSHKSILNNGKSIGERMLLTERDLVCCPPPLFHCFGNVCGYMATATHGAAIVFPAEAFDAVETLHSLRDYRCTALYGVPTMFIAQLEALQEGMVSLDGFENLRTGTIAGSTVAPELMRILHQRLNLTELTICYGMTETSPISAMTTMADPMDRRIDSVGRLLPNVEAKIVAPDDPTRILPIGERGEVAVSGYHVMKGYWEAPSRTAEVLIPDTDGKVWMHSGDEGMMDAEGFLKITGRLKDLIIRGGENIHPLEIENCLLAHPAIADVAVVGLPDDRYGECVAAFAVAHCGASITSDEVRDWVRARLSHHLGEFPNRVSRMSKRPS